MSPPASLARSLSDASIHADLTAAATAMQPGFPRTPKALCRTATPSTAESCFLFGASSFGIQFKDSRPGRLQKNRTPPTDPSMLCAFRRTKTWRRPRLHPRPSMHRRVSTAIQMVGRMAGSGAEPQILVQYLVLRKDLAQAPFSWPTGALVAQACHAATAALHLHRDHPHTVAYLRELGRMRKVVLEVSRRRVPGRKLREGRAEAGSRSTGAQTLASGSRYGKVVGGIFRSLGNGLRLERLRSEPSREGRDREERT